MELEDIMLSELSQREKNKSVFYGEISQWIGSMNNVKPLTLVYKFEMTKHCPGLGEGKGLL